MTQSSGTPVAHTAGEDVELVDIGVATAAVSQVVLMRGGSTDGTIAGIFVDEFDFPVSVNGVTFSYSATVSSTPQTLLTLFGLTAVPVSSSTKRIAVGFVGNTSIDMWYCEGSADGLTVPAALATDMVANPSRYGPLPQGPVHIGRA